MKRGEVVTVVVPGAYGKPRPALIIQSDLFDEHPSVTILPITSELRDTPLFRITVTSTPENGLLKTSQVMEDKRSEEHTSELQSPCNLVCRLLLEKKKSYLPRDGNRLLLLL